jgi:hypothetical protein
MFTLRSDGAVANAAPTFALSALPPHEPSPCAPISSPTTKPAAAKHSLSAAIMQLGDAWARPLETTWYVQSKERAAALEARLGALSTAMRVC